MTPYYQDDAVTIYHGDCREIIDELEPIKHLGGIKMTRSPKRCKNCTTFILPIAPDTKYDEEGEDASGRNVLAVSEEGLNERR